VLCWNRIWERKESGTAFCLKSEGMAKEQVKKGWLEGGFYSSPIQTCGFERKEDVNPGRAMKRAKGGRGGILGPW